MNKAQAALAEETMQYIEAFPDEHDQSQWVNLCGTKFCFAGTVVRIAHPDWFFEVDENGHTTGHVLDADRKDVGSISRVSDEALGLERWQSGLLYWGGNSIATLRRQVNELIAEVQ